MKYQSRQWSKAVYRNVSKHSSIKITAVSQGILSKNFLGISWCLFSEILYSAELRKNRKTSCDQAAVVRPRSCSADEITSRRQAHEPAGHCSALIADLDTSLKIHLISINDQIVFPPTRLLQCWQAGTKNDTAPVGHCARNCAQPRLLLFAASRECTH